MIHAAPEPSIRSGGSAPVAMAMLDDHEIFNTGVRCMDKPESRLSILNTEFRYVNNPFIYKGYKVHIDSCSNETKPCTAKSFLYIRLYQRSLVTTQQHIPIERTKATSNFKSKRSSDPCPIYKRASMHEEVVKEGVHKKAIRDVRVDKVVKLDVVDHQDAYKGFSQVQRDISKAV